MASTPKKTAASPMAVKSPAKIGSKSVAVSSPSQPSFPEPLPRKPLEFGDLPFDIKSLIASFVIKSSDERNLCLTSKVMHAATVPSMYRAMTLYVGSPMDAHIGSLLNPKNIGLKHIRSLDIFLANVSHACNQLQQANVSIRLILEYLPDDILETFCWHPWSTFSADNLMLLFRKQKRLGWREGIALDRNVVSELEKFPNVDDLFSKTVRLGLYPDGVDTLEYSNFLIRKSRNLNHLVIHTNFHGRDELTSRDINDSATGPGLMTRTLFSHMIPFQECTPLKLKRLVLHGVSLRYAGSTYCNVVDCTGLTSLQINQCPGADAFFAELCKSSKLPLALKTLHVKQEDNDENDTLVALDGFLCLVSGIKVLSINLCNSKELPAAPGVQRHFKTLEELNVHARRGGKESEEIVYGYDAFRNITKNCKQLRHLSVAFPSTSLIRPNTTAFTNFEGALDTLPNLLILNITTWPSNAPSKRQLPRKIYEHLLQSIAQQCFERHSILIPATPDNLPAPSTSGTTTPANDNETNNNNQNNENNDAGADPNPTTTSSSSSSSSTLSTQEVIAPSSRLTAIAFGPSCDGDSLRAPIVFTKGRLLHPAASEEQMLATKLDWTQRRYFTPWSDVLDFALATCTGPPTTEPASEDA
jgi:hypothetical protein